MHYNTMNSYTCVNCVEIYKCKAKDFEMSSDNFSKRFLVDNIKKTRLYVYFCDFSLDYHSIYVDILGAHKHILKKHDIN